MAEYRRFFVPPESADADGRVIVDGNEFAHLKKVLRMREGDKAVVCFNDGLDRFCEIERIENNRALLRVVETRLNAAEFGSKITLYQALMKGDKFDFCVQKAVELGVGEIVPFESRFTVAKWDVKKTDRYRRIAFEASKQCGRSRLAGVENCVGFEELIERLRRHETVIFCNETERGNKLLRALDAISVPKDMAVVIGSEGGFSPEEIGEISRLKNAVSVSFGKRILRAETASVFALSVISAWLDGLSEEN